MAVTHGRSYCGVKSASFPSRAKGSTCPLCGRVIGHPLDSDPVVVMAEASPVAALTGVDGDSFGPVAVCTICGATFSEAVPFCSQCGNATETPDPEVVIEALRRKVATLEPQARGPLTGFTWGMVPEGEKWATAWGVWWRTLVATFALAVVLNVILNAVASN